MEPDYSPHAVALAAYLLKVIVCVLLATLETMIAKMRVFRVPNLLGIALMLACWAHYCCSSSGGM